MIKKNESPIDFRQLTPLEVAHAEAGLFSVNMNITHMIQLAVRTLVECEEFLSTADGEDLDVLADAVKEERDKVLKTLCDMADNYERIFKISA